MPPSPAGSAWMDVVFRTVTPGTVQLTVHNLNLGADDSVDHLYFNLAPDLDPRKLQFSYKSGSGGFDLPTISKGANSFYADGNGDYDIRLDFSPFSTASHQFTQGEYFTYTITGIYGLDASDFGWLSSPSGGPGYGYTAAHVNRNGHSLFNGWICCNFPDCPTPIPEPSSASFLGLALALLLGFHLWKRGKKAEDQAKARCQPVPIPVKRKR